MRSRLLVPGMSSVTATMSSRYRSCVPFGFIGMSTTSSLPTPSGSCFWEHDETWFLTGGGTRDRDGENSVVGSHLSS